MASWLDLKKSVETMLSESRKHANANPHAFEFSADGSRLFYLGNTPSAPNTQQLLSVSLASHDTPQPVLPKDWNRSGGNEKISKEEALLRERKREKTTGINSFTCLMDHQRFLFPAGSALYSLQLSGGASVGTTYPSTIPSSSPGARIDAQMCPSNPDLIAFVRDQNLWLAHAHDGTELQLTHLSEEGTSAGSPPYIVQEEFSRYSGYWWAPVNKGETRRILFEEVDERMVRIIHIPQQDAAPEPHRYPLAGTDNAVATLRVAEFQEGLSLPVRVRSLPCSLKEAYPWSEYLVRACWTPEGDKVCVQLLDRSQTRLALVMIPLDAFVYEAPPSPVSSIPGARVLCEETTDVWINVHDILHIFPSAADPNTVRFLWASERTGYRHLYLVTASSVGAPDCKQLTSGDWQVEPDGVWVDTSAGAIYFMATRLSPQRLQLFRLAASSGFQEWKAGFTSSDAIVWKDIEQLTSSDYTHWVDVVNTELGLFVDVFSSPSTPPSAAVYRLANPSEPVNTFWSLPAVVGYEAPELFDFKGADDITFYGHVWRPKGLQDVPVDKTYPCVWFLYAGPCEQLVTYAYRGPNFLRFAHMASLGYYVVMLDGRGSNRRGLRFEGHIKHRMGTVEIADQVAGVRYMLESQRYAIDPARIAIHGWSYGGYASLLGLAQRPDIFKVAIAGAPVTTWSDYDTGYTERYMGHPEANAEGYKGGSVLELAKQFPDTPNRLLIIHGANDENVLFTHTSKLVSELIHLGKPHQLQVYPQERHGIRTLNSCIHYETLVLDFLARNLSA